MPREQLDGQAVDVPRRRGRGIHDKPRCGATTRDGAPCGQVAGWATDHVGWGRCARHGGATPNHRQAAAAAMAQAHVASLVGLVPTEPHEAFEWLLARQRALVEYYDARIAELEQHGPAAVAGQATVTHTRPAKGEKGADLSHEVVEVRQLPPAASVWITLRDAAADRLAQFAKLAADARIGERRVRIEEARLDAIAGVLNAVMRELRAAGLLDELHRLAGESFRRHAAQLEVVAGTAREVVA